MLEYSNLFIIRYEKSAEQDAEREETPAAVSSIKPSNSGQAPRLASPRLSESGRIMADAAQPRRLSRGGRGVT